MPRVARIVAKGYPHHITQRGNYKQTVFAKENDYKFYLDRLNEYRKRYRLSMLAYCLMPNHVHFVAIPESEDSLAKTFNTCHMRYAHYFNKRNRATGHLWQGRFYSCILDDEHLYSTVRYVENNPARAKLVKNAWDWNWSSARVHMKKGEDVLSLTDINKFLNITDWKDYLNQRGDEELIKRIKVNTLTGRPLGSNAFVEKLETILGKRLKALPRGRPKKK